MSRYDNTVRFLKAIAKKLSARRDCRDVEYIIEILSTASSPEVHQIIKLTPPIMMYPDAHHRKRIDLDIATKHVLKSLEIDSINSGDGRIVISGEPFITGIFQYRRSFDGKYRAWFSNPV